jgi:putative FmdB family regulatory protein
MPIYNYKCSSCNHRFKRVQKYSEKEQTLLEKCEKCNKEDIIEVVSFSSFILKGQRWFKNGYT